MSKVKEKWLELGTGADQHNSRGLPANFTPSNYVPVQVASEGADKVSAHLKGIDAALGGAAAFTVEDFDVGGGGQSVFQLATGIDSSQKIEVLVNGTEVREGAGNTWERDEILDRINFDSSQPENAWVRVKIYPLAGAGGAFNFQNYDVGAGGQAAFVYSAGISASQIVEALINGREYREGGSDDFTRTPATNTITFAFTVPENAFVKLKVYD